MASTPDADRPVAWHLAACAGFPTAWFFPRRGANAPTQAKAVCATCPIAADCLAYALAGYEHVGVWGGTSDRERRRIGYGRV